MAAITDILFDIGTREIVMKNDDFATTDNPSVQNGGIIEAGKGFNPENPLLGIGLLKGLQGANAQRLTFDMNRWKSQCINDGATLARWTGTMNFGKANVQSEISYI